MLLEKEKSFSSFLKKKEKKNGVYILDKTKLW